MFKPSRALIALSCALFVVACHKPAAADSSATATAGKDAPSDQPVPSDISSDAQQFGYSVGFDIGHSLAQVKDDVDVKALEKGLEEAIAGQPARLSDKQREAVKTAVVKKLQQKQIEERAAKAKQNQEDGEKFLADNAKRSGVKTTADGLQYEVVSEGKGDHPTKDDKVTVNYKGTLIDNTVFDSSYDRNQPVTFPLANVIPGWTEGLQLMTPGSKYKFYIPSNLGYGERGAGMKIGPNSTLIFEVELISIDKGGAKPAAPPAPAPAAPAAKK